MSTTMGTNEREFYIKIESLIARAKAVGMDTSKLCSAAGVGRATPDRWRIEAPKTIKLLDSFEQAVLDAENKAAK